MVCLSCTLRVAVPAAMRQSVLAEGWDVLLVKAQETFERKVRERDSG